MEPTHLLDYQQAIISAPLQGADFLEGPAGSGKTTAGVQRVLSLVESGIPASSILVLLPQRTLGRSYARALHDPNFPAGGLPSILTIGGLAQRVLRLFWPAIANSAGFKRAYDPPVFLTLETAQYFMARIVRPLLDQGYFEELVIDRNRLYSQILDNLNKSALVGFPHTEISERLKSAWIGKPSQLTLYDQAQDCANLFRAFCLENNLLDYSLQLEVFAQQLWPSHLVRQYLNNQFRYLIYDNVEEDVPVAQDIIAEWLPDFMAALLIYDQGSGFRAFLGADPDYGQLLRDKCTRITTVNDNLITSSELKQFGAVMSASIQREPSMTVPVTVKRAFSYEHQRFSTQMVDWVSQKTAELVREEGVTPGEIVILSPFLSDALRYALMNRLEGYGIPAYSHRPSRSLRDEPAAQVLITLAKLAHPQWGLEAHLDAVRSTLAQCISGLDLVRADLLSRIVFRSKSKDGPLLDFAPLLPDIRERISYAIGERYSRLRDWLLSYRAGEPVELDVFLARLFGEILSQPGFGFHENYEAAGVAARLIESIEKFRNVVTTDIGGSPGDVGKEYLRMVQEGILAAQYLPLATGETPDAVFLAPAYTFLIANRPVRIQFWLDAGGLGWWERLYQPLTHPQVLSRRWQPDRIWTDIDEVQNNQVNLTRLVNGLISRCSEHIYLCSMKINERGAEERGPLLQAIQSMLRRLRETEGDSRV